MINTVIRELERSDRQLDRIGYILTNTQTESTTFLHYDVNVLISEKNNAFKKSFINILSLNFLSFMTFTKSLEINSTYEIVLF